jgi:hypothetical protein
MPDAKLFAPRNRGYSAAMSLEAARLAKASDAMDFSHEDAAPALELNDVIWKSVRGVESKMPAPRTSHLLPVGKSQKDDDDD